MLCKPKLVERKFVNRKVVKEILDLLCAEKLSRLFLNLLRKPKLIERKVVNRKVAKEIEGSKVVK